MNDAMLYRFVGGVKHNQHLLVRDNENTGRPFVEFVVDYDEAGPICAVYERVQIECGATISYEYVILGWTAELPWKDYRKLHHASGDVSKDFHVDMPDLPPLEVMVGARMLLAAAVKRFS